MSYPAIFFLKKRIFSRFLSQFGDTSLALSSSRQLSKESTSIMRVRRSSDNAESDFSAQEVANGTLLDYVVPTDVQALYSNRMYFDGVNDYVALDSAIVFAGDFDLTWTAIMGASGAHSFFGDPNIISNDNFIVLTSLSEMLIRVSDNNSFITLNSALSVGEEYTFRLNRTSNTLTLYIDEVAQTDTEVNSSTLTLQNIGSSGYLGGVYMTGSIYDVNFNDGASYLGHGNTNTDWEDQIGTNDGTVNGSPALFTGQGFNGLVPIWYDQRVPTSTNKMHFNGVSGKITSVSPAIPATDDFDLTFKYIPQGLSSSTDDIISQYDLFPKEGRLLINTRNNNIRLFIGSSTGNVDIESNDNPLVNGTEYEIRATRISNDFTLYLDGEVIGTENNDVSINQNNNFIAGWSTNDRYLQGTVYDVVIDGILQWNGHGNTNAAWTDQVGSNDGTVNGSPARYNPDTGAISRDATQTTAGSQPAIVENGAVVIENTKATLDYDGTDDYARIPHDQFPTPTTELQASVVAKNNKSTLPGSSEYIIAQYESGTDNRSWAVLINSADKLTVNLGNSSTGGFGAAYISTSTIDIDNIHTVGFTYNAGTVKLYVDGVEVAGSATDSIPATLFNTTADVTIGCALSSNAPVVLWDGQIGDVYIADNLDDDIVKVQQNQMRAYNI